MQITIPSETTKDLYYKISLGQSGILSCSCSKFQYRKECKHIKKNKVMINMILNPKTQRTKEVKMTSHNLEDVFYSIKIFNDNNNKCPYNTYRESDHKNIKTM
tara:strand:+ start:1152 stop:1460 length:309 start_codon:yes stop_codon:yes gene_type:complete